MWQTVDVNRSEGIRARNRAALEAEILRVGREHLGSHGAAALSLRAVARELGLSSSAVYRYVDSRDELLTRLIVAAYDAMADHVEAALAGLPRRASASRRFRTLSQATREWALASPHEFALIYGSPVPNYHAPAERTEPAGTRVPNLLVGLLNQIDGPHAPSRRDARAMATLLTFPAYQAAGISAATVRRGMTAWTLVLGTVTAEVFEQFGADTISDWDAYFEAVVDTALAIVTD